MSINHLFVHCLKSGSMLFPCIRAAIQLAHAHHSVLEVKSSPGNYVQIFSLNSGLGGSSWSLADVITVLVEGRRKDELFWMMSQLPSFNLILESIDLLKHKDCLTGITFIHLLISFEYQGVFQVDGGCIKLELWLNMPNLDLTSI